MTDIYTLGIKADTRDLDRGKKRLDDLAMSADRAETQANRFTKSIRFMDARLKTTNTGIVRLNKSSKATSAGFKGMSRSAGQVGIQLQQLAGQVQSGTRFMTALAQQSADIGIVLGAPLIGVLVSFGAVLGGMLVPSLFETKKTTEELIDEIKDLTHNFETLTDAQRDFIELKYADKIADQREKVMGLSDSYETAESRIQMLTDRISQLSSVSGEGLFGGGDNTLAIKKTQEEIERLNGTMTERQALIDTEQQKLDRLIELQQLITGERTKSTEELLKEKGALSAFVLKIEQESELLGKSARQKAIYTAENMGATASDIERINSAYALIEAHEAQIEAEKELEQRIKAIIATNERRSASNERAAAQEEAFRARSVSGLVDSLLSETQSENQRYAQKLATLEAANEQELTIIGGYDNAKEMLEREHQTRLTEIARQGNKQRMAAISGSINAIGGLFVQLQDSRYQMEMQALRNTEGMSEQEIKAREKAAKAAFENSKKLQAGLVVMNTAGAIMNELATNPDPFSKWFNVATIGATGLTQLSRINSQQFGGGSSIATPAPVNNQTSNTTNNTSVTVNVSGGNPQDVVAAIQNYIGDGGILFTNDTEQGRVVNG